MSPESNPLLTAPIRRTVILLALPVLGEQFLNFLVGTVDVYLAGNLPDDASLQGVSAVGAAAYIGWLASLVFSLVGTGTTALISRAWGAGDREHANKVLNRSIALSWIIGIVFLLLMQFFASHVARVMGVEGDSLPIAVRYLRIDAIGLMFASVTLVASAALRGCGDMRTPMVILGIINVLNVIMSTAMVYGWGPLEPWGVDGIVMGTTISRILGGVLLLAYLSFERMGLVLKLSDWRLRGETVRRILSVGTPAAGEGLLTWIGHVIFLSMIGRLGETAYNAHIIGVRVEAISYLPAVAWGSAAATLVGQSIGANKPDRAWEAGHEAAMQCGLFGVLTTLLFVVRSDLVFALMHNETSVRELGVPALRLLGAFQIPLMLAIVYAHCLRGAGDTRYPVVIAIITTYVIRIPVGYFFGFVLGMGFFGVWIGMTIDISFRWILNATRYWSKKWLHVKV
ncbi:MAG: MATE family efflux transporter [Planctomycetaceae bacterium]|nr:MATE family efflux transporter [Planctomycetaceae bacterium]MCB9953125.1 MATE family efflux transporter [Planctomycetaceae bacterium]